MNTYNAIVGIVSVGLLGVLPMTSLHAQSNTIDSDTIETLKNSPGLVTSGNDNLKLTISGQVNRGLLSFDDGDETGTLHVDNDNSSTRIRLLSEADLTERATFGTNIELQFESNSTAAVDQNNERNVGPNGFTERKLEAYGDFDGIGRITIGQGDTASNGASEQDLSGTSVVGYSGVADLASGLRFRSEATEELSDINIGSVFSNLDGLSRDDRLRFDSPTIQGFNAAASLVADERWDVAIRYSGKSAGFSLSAALAYANTREDLENRVNGSASILHSSGLSATAAAGRDERDDRDPQFVYLKFGYQAQWNRFGKSAVSVDFYDAEDIAAAELESNSVGIQLVQKLDKIGTDVYAGLRNYSLDDNDADDILASLVGVRVKF